MLLWTFIHKFCKDIYFYSVGYIPRGEIAASMFNFMRHLQAIFHSSCTILHSPQRCTRVLIFPHPHQHSLSIILITAILVGVKWYLIVVLIFISQMPNDVKLFVLIGHLYISFGEMSIQTFLSIFNWVFILSLSSNSYVFWIQIPY